jgi:hypothetical protein
MFLTSDEGLAAGVVDLFSPRWKNGAGERAQARSVTDRAGAARLASCGRDRLRDRCRGERKANVARGLDDTESDFQQT